MFRPKIINSLSAVFLSVVILSSLTAFQVYANKYYNGFEGTDNEIEEVEDDTPITEQDVKEAHEILGIQKEAKAAEKGVDITDDVKKQMEARKKAEQQQKKNLHPNFDGLNQDNASKNTSTTQTTKKVTSPPKPDVGCSASAMKAANSRNITTINAALDKEPNCPALYSSRGKIKFKEASGNQSQQGSGIADLQKASELYGKLGDHQKVQTISNDIDKKTNIMMNGDTSKKYCTRSGEDSDAPMIKAALKKTKQDFLNVKNEYNKYYDTVYMPIRKKWKAEKAYIASQTAEYNADKTGSNKASLEQKWVASGRLANVNDRILKNNALLEEMNVLKIKGKDLKTKKNSIMNRYNNAYNAAKEGDCQKAKNILESL